MTKTYRLKAQPTKDQNLRINVTQDFDFLEILSLKLRQEDQDKDQGHNKDQDRDQVKDKALQIKRANKQAEPSSKLWLVSSSQPLLLSELSELASLSMTDACVEATFLEMGGWLILKPGGRYTRGYGK